MVLKLSVILWRLSLRVKPATSLYDCAVPIVVPSPPLGLGRHSLMQTALCPAQPGNGSLTPCRKQERRLALEARQRLQDSRRPVGQRHQMVPAILGALAGD